MCSLEKKKKLLLGGGGNYAMYLNTVWVKCKALLKPVARKIE